MKKKVPHKIKSLVFRGSVVRVDLRHLAAGVQRLLWAGRTQSDLRLRLLPQCGILLHLSMKTTKLTVVIVCEGKTPETLSVFLPR